MLTKSATAASDWKSISLKSRDLRADVESRKATRFSSDDSGESTRAVSTSVLVNFAIFCVVLSSSAFLS